MCIRRGDLRSPAGEHSSPLLCSENILMRTLLMPCFFCALSVGASAPNPDTRNFSRKVSWNFKSFRQSEVLFLSEVLWNFKSFAEVKWYVRWEILLPTFLTRKVGGTPFSERKVWSGKVRKFHFDFERFSAISGNYVVFIRNALSVYFYADNVASASVAPESYIIYASAEYLLYGRFIP